MEFRSILVAKHSPKNGCFGTDGELLYLLHPVEEPDQERGPVFTGVSTKSQNRFGWVKKTEVPFKLDEFLSRIRLPKNDRNSDLQVILLTVIDRLEEGVPVAVDYFPRGLPPKPKLVVHKVIFEKPVRT